MCLIRVWGEVEVEGSRCVQTERRTGAQGLWCVGECFCLREVGVSSDRGRDERLRGVSRGGVQVGVVLQVGAEERLGLVVCGAEPG